ncbi:F0F1 ATP synthase subunit delta [Candidatus Cytomitobacter indipagum]|nr:F0F1 ATP synthase subunit delta [Candidatus Cytomitobacter indipagum]
MNLKNILKIIPKEYIKQFSKDINYIVTTRNALPSLWSSMPVSGINALDLLDLSSFSKEIIQHIRNSSTWTDFNEIISQISKIVLKDEITHAHITIASKNEELESELKQYILRADKEANIKFKYKTNILGGFLIDIGSIRIDGSYVNMLSKFIGELNESLKF